MHIFNFRRNFVHKGWCAFPKQIDPTQVINNILFFRDCPFIGTMNLKKLRKFLL